METPTIYLTREQIYRLVEVANNALVGVQIHTDASDDTALRCESVFIEDEVDMHYFWIGADGTMRDET